MPQITQRILLSHIHRQAALVQFPASPWRLATLYNSSSRASNTFFLAFSGNRAHGLCLLVLVDIFIVALICGGFHESHNHDYMWVLTLLLWMLAADLWGHWKILVRAFVTDEVVVVFGSSGLYVSFIMQNCQFLDLYPFLAVPNSLSAQGCLAAWSLLQSAAEGRLSSRAES